MPLKVNFSTHNYMTLHLELGESATEEQALMLKRAQNEDLHEFLDHQHDEQAFHHDYRTSVTVDWVDDNGHRVSKRRGLARPCGGGVPLLHGRGRSGLALGDVGACDPPPIDPMTSRHGVDRRIQWTTRHSIGS